MFQCSGKQAHSLTPTPPSGHLISRRCRGVMSKAQAKSPVGACGWMLEWQRWWKNTEWNLAGQLLQRRQRQRAGSGTANWVCAEKRLGLENWKVTCARLQWVARRWHSVSVSVWVCVDKIGKMMLFFALAKYTVHCFNNALTCTWAQAASHTTNHPV